MRSLTIKIAMALVGLLAAGAMAQSFPERTVKIVVPYPPGGFNDTLGRVSAEKLTKIWDQPVIVENRPGGNTTTANAYVARSQPDGYTLLVTPLPFSSLPGLYGNRLSYDAIKDFQPLVWAGSSHNVLVVRNDLPINNVRELIDYAKRNPGKLNYGTPGSGSSLHLSMELFMNMTNTKMVHIPYKGSAASVMALLSGEVDVFFENMPNVIQHIKSGKMRAIGVTGSKRSYLLPDVPTVAAAGVPGYEVTVWFGMQVPAGTPQPIVDKLNRDMVSILKDPDVVSRFQAQGVEIVASTPDEFKTLVEREVTKWTRIIRQADIRID